MLISHSRGTCLIATAKTLLIFLPGCGRGLVGELVGDDPGLLRGVVHEGDGGALPVEVDHGEHAPGEARGRDALAEGPSTSDVRFEWGRDVQGDASGRLKLPVDLDLGCSTILFGQ